MFKLSQLKWKETAIGFLIITILFLFVELKKTDSELKQVQAAYAHPQIKEVERIIRVAGPVRIITKIIEKPGEKQTFIQEDRKQETQVEEAKKESTPIPVDVVMPKPRTDRILLTLGVNQLSLDTEGKLLMVGYGWNNRFDLQAGIIQRNDTSPWVMGTVRF